MSNETNQKTDDEIKAEERKVRETFPSQMSDDEDENIPGAFHSVTNPKVSKRGEGEDDEARERRRIVSTYVTAEKGDDENSGDDSADEDLNKDETTMKRKAPRALSPGVTAVGKDSSQSKAEVPKATGSADDVARKSRSSTHSNDDDETTVPPPGGPLRRAPVTYRDTADPNAPPPVQRREPEEAKVPEGSELSAELVDEQADQERLKQTLENVLQTQNAVQVVDVEAEDRLKRKRERRNLCLYTLLGAAVVGAVVAAVVITSNNQKTLTYAPTIAPSLAPTMAPTTRLSAVLEAVVAEFGDLPEDETSPQHKAIEWLTEKDTTIEFPLNSEEDQQTFLERYVAVVFAYTTQYVYWINNDNWLNPDTSVCDGWFGLSCNDDGHIGVLDLAIQNLDGTIPSELGYLEDLDFVFLFRNKLRGPIPSELGKLGDVDFLYLNENQLTGQIPDELSGLLDADELLLFGNQLTGTIPPDFGGLVDLVNLYMHDNMLSGEIPSSLSQLKRLQRLYLQDNKLQGTIPSELGGIISLQRIQLQNNSLTGPVPPELGSFFGLSVLKLEGNQLTGDMPAEICALRDIGPVDDLEILEADCAKPGITGIGINCTCCTTCF